MLTEQIRQKKSFLCIGLDSDLNKIPNFLKKNYKNPIFAFNKAIIDATQHLAVSYKLNTAFYEAQGTLGWEAMQQTLDIIPKDIFIIADAKRGDIGNTADSYAKAFFEKMDFDAVTIAPYMGKDSVTPFLQYDQKYAIVLGLTSNNSALDFQMLTLENGEKLYENVLKTASTWGNEKNMMFVIGATKTSALENIRKIIPNHFLLIPGVGTQGGNLEEVIKYGRNAEEGLLINISRDIIFAFEQEITHENQSTTHEENFAQLAQKRALYWQQEMAKFF